MALKTKVKVGNLTNLSEARYCAGMGVDFLGFPLSNFEDDLRQFREISSWISGPMLILECGDAEVIGRLVTEEIDVDFIQVELIDLHATKVAAYKLFIMLPDDPTASLLETLRDFKHQNHFLVISPKGFEKNKNHLEGFGVFIGHAGGDYDLEQLSSYSIDGISLAGNDEIKPGIQDYRQLANVLDQLEISED